MEADQYLNPEQVTRFLEKHLKAVFAQEEFSSDTFTPICLWGEAGIGKTELIRNLSQKNNWSMVHLSLAQIEESGDILGLPYLKDDLSGKKTAYAKPEWVPDQQGPGVLLIDDFNRADSRILNAFMEVFQFYSTSSWTLPSKWFIILTANPVHANYFVQKVDQAIMDRILHIQVKFKLESWLRWAMEQKFNEQLLFFPLLFPEQFANSKSSPRTWSKLFRQISQMDSGEKDQIRMLINLYLPKEEASFFWQFIDANQIPLLKPNRLLELNQIQMDAYLEDLQLKYQQPILLIAIGRSLVRYLKEVGASSLNGRVLNRFWLSKQLPTDIRLEQLVYLQEQLSQKEQELLALGDIQGLMLDLRN